MRPLVTAAQMAVIEAAAVRTGRPVAVLIEAAAEAAFQYIRTQWPDWRGWRIVVLCGPGNNGNDARALADKLRAAGADVAAIAVMGAVDAGAGSEHILQQAAAADLIVDGIFGTGARPLTGDVATLVTGINALSKVVFSLDLPTGVDADTGAADLAIQATRTLTFGYAKAGLYQYPGREAAGAIDVAPIGLDAAVPEDIVFDRFVIEPRDVRVRLPAIRPDSHKGTFGKVLVAGGSVDYPGAPRLAGVAAYRAGAGLVTLAATWPLYDYLVGHELGLTLLPFDAETQSPFARLADVQAVLAGPGWGRGESTASLVRTLLECNTAVPMILDADALFYTPRRWLVDSADSRSYGLVLTPHPKEFAGLTGLSLAAVQADRLRQASAAARAWGCVVVLKGANTVIADGEGRAYICDAAVPALAVAGTGDVLAGMIAGLAAQGASVLDAAIAAVYSHAAAALRWTETHGSRGMLADDLLTLIPATLAHLRGEPRPGD